MNITQWSLRAIFFLITESEIYDIDKNFNKVGDYYGII